MPETPSRWEVVASLLAEISELPEDLRERHLNEKTGGDPQLRGEILSLLAVAIPAVDVLETPALRWLPPADIDAAEALFESPKRLDAGDILAGRFRIEYFLGRGGMAEVYAALDIELDVRIALKLLHPDLSRRADFVDRFRREIALARRVSHPGVASVFDFVECGGLYFFAMQLVEGVTLSTRLRRGGALPVRDALPLARQLAAGLDAAHRARVIHRDFKPANIMLGSDGPVITDFGLAAVSGKPPSGPHSQLLGTPGYVAPEIWAGRAASPASDIYSYGVVLHEIIAGSHPNAASAGKLKIPSEWRTAIDRCLQLDPAKRWRAATEAADALAPGWSRRKTVGALGAASLAGLGLRYGLREGKPAAFSKIMLAAIDNQTGEEALSGFDVLLRDQVSQSAHLLPLPPQAVRAARRRMDRADGPLTPEIAREVAMREGAPLAAFGRLEKVNGEYALDLRLDLTSSDPSQPARQWRKRFAAPARDGVFQMASMAGDWLRESAGENPRDLLARSKPPQALTTNSWEALRLFAEAERAQFAGERARDVVLYREALRHDAGFSLACYRIADLLVNRAEFDQGLEYWDRALELSKKKGVTTYEMLKIRRSYCDDTWRHAELLESAQVSLAQWPNDYLGHFFLAMGHSHLGRGEAAVESLRAAVKLEPASEAAWYQLCAQLLFAGRFAEVRECLPDLRKAASAGAAALMEGKLAFFENRFDDARRLFEGLSRRDGSQPDGPRWRVQGTLFLAMLECELGRWPQARETLLQGIGFTRGGALAGEEAQHHFLAAQVAAHLDDKAACREHAEAIEAAGRGFLAAARAGVVLARAGFPAEAAARLAALRNPPNVPRLIAARHALAGELALANRDLATAKREFEARASLEPAELPREYLWRAGDRQHAATLLKEPGKFWWSPESAPLGSWSLLRKRA